MILPGSLGMDRHLRSIGRSVYRYGNASHAFKDVLLFLKGRLPGGTANVVMPSFMPAKLYRTALAAGYEPRCYRVTGGCRFDPQEVEDLVDGRTTSLFAIHYFGYPADMASLRDIAERRGVALIEDCAHVLLGSVNGKTLGSLGDFSLFSARKMLQLSDGGFLVANVDMPGFRPAYAGRVRSLYTVSRFVLSRAKRSFVRLAGGRDLLGLVRPSPVGRIDPGRKIELRVRKMSYATTLFGMLADIQRNAHVRRMNYLRLAEGLQEFAFLRPVHGGPPVTWTPYSLPMMVEGKKRSFLAAELGRRGISCGLGWPESPYGGGWADTRELAEGLIEFSVHPPALDGQVERVRDACRTFGRRI